MPDKGDLRKREHILATGGGTLPYIDKVTGGGAWGRIQSDADRCWMLHKFLSAFYSMAQDHRAVLSTWKQALPPQSTSSGNSLTGWAPWWLQSCQADSISPHWTDWRLFTGCLLPRNPSTTGENWELTPLDPPYHPVLVLALHTPSLFMMSFCFFIDDLNCQGDTLSQGTMVFSIKIIPLHKISSVPVLMEMNHFLHIVMSCTYVTKCMETWWHTQTFKHQMWFSICLVTFSCFPISSLWFPGAPPLSVLFISPSH